MRIHEEVLRAANELSDAQGRFRVDDVVRRLAHLKQTTVRTHITSRCCVNAPKHHATKLPYFRRVGRGEYEVLPRYRAASVGRSASPQQQHVDPAEHSAGAPSRNAIHALITFAGGWYTAECLEISAVTQGRTLDETVKNLREAVSLHLDEPADVGRAGLPDVQLVISCELPLSA